MDRNAQNGMHQRRSAIVRRSKATQAVEFFNVLTSPALLETTESALSATTDNARLFTLIAQCRVGNRPGRVVPRMRKRRPKPYTWLKIPRAHARRKIERHGHAWEAK